MRPGNETGSEVVDRSRGHGKDPDPPREKIKLNDVLKDIAEIARRAARCADNAQIAVLEIRDRAEAAQSNGLSDDDTAEIRRMLNHMTVSLAGADRELGDLSGRAKQL